MEAYQKGNIVEAFVTGITDYGIFVSLRNNYSGLVHISDLSYLFVSNINDFVKIGDTIFVRILDIDDKTRRLRLNIKDISSSQRTRKIHSKIKETTHGFYTLSYQLSLWIGESLKKLEKERISIDKQGIK